MVRAAHLTHSAARGGRHNAQRPYQPSTGCAIITAHRDPAGHAVSLARGGLPSLPRSPSDIRATIGQARRQKNAAHLAPEQRVAA